MAICQPPPERLTDKQFIEKISPTGRKGEPQRRCAVSTIQNNNNNNDDDNKKKTNKNILLP
jgi:hypothetical protein